MFWKLFFRNGIKSKKSWKCWNKFSQPDSRVDRVAGWGVLSWTLCRRSTLRVPLKIFKRWRKIIHNIRFVSDKRLRNKHWKEFDKNKRILISKPSSPPSTESRAKKCLIFLTPTFCVSTRTDFLCFNHMKK